MKIRADLEVPAAVTPDEWEWIESPQAGVTRVMLDRVGDEVAVATSFVRYAEGSRFPGHGHALGEEFIVLEGEFGDEHGRYPPGSYVRNPPGSRHVPFSDPGCLIWVKLRQFDEADQRQCVVSLTTPIPGQGQLTTPLHTHDAEIAAEIVAARGEVIELEAAGEVREVLVLEGSVASERKSYPQWSWLRIPADRGITLSADAPTRLFTKTRPVYRPAE